MKRDALILSLAAAMSMAFAAPALAKTAQDEPTGGSAKVEKKTCRTFQNSASRLKSTKLCLTKAEWKKFDAAQ